MGRYHNDTALPCERGEQLDDSRTITVAKGCRRFIGENVEFHQEDLGSVSPGAQLAICAIVREGLGNSARHAGFTRVQVGLSREHDTIAITVTDDGPSTGWTAAPEAGHGLLGLRERVNSLGGTLHAGPHATGFRLEATVPEGAR